MNLFETIVESYEGMTGREIVGEIVCVCLLVPLAVFGTIVLFAVT